MSAVAFSVTVWVFIICSAALTLRLLSGPTAADRLTALAAIAALILGVLVILSLYTKLSFFLDVALVYAILGFLGILAIALYTKDNHANDVSFYENDDEELPL